MSISLPSPSESVSPLAYYRAAHRSLLADSLPDLDFSDSILEKMSFLPPEPDGEVRAEPARARLKYLGELARIHIALNRDRDLAESIDGMIRDGYLARGSVAQQRAAAPGQTEQLLRAAEETSDQKVALGRLLSRARSVHTPVDTRSLIGVPGTGKTRTVHQARNLYPKSIAFPAARDPRLPPLMIPGLIAEAPADRTIPSLHANVVQAVELTTGEEIPARLKRGNRSERISMLADLLQHYHVGILILDEIQKLVRADGKPDYILLNFLLEIANTLKVPVLFVGTPASQKLLASELRNARRMLGRPWVNYAKDSKEWDRLVTALWPYQFTAEFTPLDAELKAALYEETVGLPGFLVRLFRETQRVLLLANLQTQANRAHLPERITPVMLKAVAKAIFAPVRPMLNALRSGVLEEIACFEDLTLDEKAIDAQIRELAEYRRREFQRTIRTIRREGTTQRRRARAVIRHEVDALLGGVKAADAAGVGAPPPTAKNPTSQVPDKPTSTAGS